MRIGKKVKRIGAILAIVGIALAAVLIAQARRAPAPGSVNLMQAGDYKILGPYTHENLTIFLSRAKRGHPVRIFLPYRRL